MRAAAAGCRLYLVTPPAFDPLRFRDALTQALAAGDVACVQLRLKDAADDELRRAGDCRRPMGQRRGPAFLLNDRPDLAAQAGCDGVHVGQQDPPYDEARRLLGADRIVGVTCHDSRHLAIDAAEAGADYVAFGAFFPTTTKPSHYRPSLELLAWWGEIMTVPSVAIGGITPRNSAPLVCAGPDFLAAFIAGWGHPEGPRAAVREFNRAIAEAGSPAP